MIKNIKYGIKISSKDFNLIPNIYSNLNIIDFIEIILFADFTKNDIDFINKIKIPYAIHIPNSNYRIDFGDINENENNLKYIDKINDFKYELDPICYIIYPESGNIDLSIENIKKLVVKPLAIENMPYKSLGGGYLLGYDKNSINLFFEQIPDLKFCLDINHAIKASISLQEDYINTIEKFIKIKNPIIFHISQGNLNNELDEHLNLNQGKYDLSEIKNILVNHHSIVNLTFETPRLNKNEIKEDLKNMQFFKEI